MALAHSDTHGKGKRSPIFFSVKKTHIVPSFKQPIANSKSVERVWLSNTLIRLYCCNGPVGAKALLLPY